MRTNSLSILSKVGLLAGTAGLALTLALGGHAVAQSHGSGGAGHDSGSSHEEGHDSGAGHDSGSGHSGGSGGKKMGKGASGERGGGRGGSLRDVFKQMEIEDALEEVRGQRRGKSNAGQTGQRGGQAAADKGQSGGKKDEPQDAAEEPSDSSKPYWAGVPGGGGSAGGGGGGKPATGSLYGDLYSIIRDADGVPVLDDDGRLQYYYTDADGTVKCCIPYIVDPETGDADPDFENYAEIEAVFSRTSVVRSPERVLDMQYTEFVNSVNDDDVVKVIVDQTGRLALEMTDGSVTTIDSPLIYLTLYQGVLTGSLPNAESRTGDPEDPADDIVLDTSKFDTTTFPALEALVDGTFDGDDLSLSATFLAAAMDKSGTATSDMIVYLNTIMGVPNDLNAVTPSDTTNPVVTTTPEYVQYSEFEYDRIAFFGADDPTTEDIIEGKTIVVQVADPDNPDTWVTTTVNILDQVFDGKAADATTGIDAYTQAVDDVRAVIDYVHTYAPPETN